MVTGQGYDGRMYVECSTVHLLMTVVSGTRSASRWKEIG